MRKPTFPGSLVPKLHLGTLPDPREVSLRADSSSEAAPTSTFPSTTWERGKILLAAFALILLTPLAHAGPDDAFASVPPPQIEHVTFQGAHYLVRIVDPRTDDLQLFWKDDDGHLIRDFPALDKVAAAKGEKLLFAANAGMFEPDNKPVGLLVQNGNETTPLNLNDGQGNFYMKPNGIFLINEKHEARIIEASEYSALVTPALWATQSGPMLVHAGSIHPDFLEDSKNFKVRSGVGVRKDGTAVFVLSRDPVNFYAFAALFLYHYKCPNALFLDGDISAFYVPGIKDTPHFFGPMIGVMHQGSK